MDNNMKEENLKKKQIAILEMDEDGISVPNWLFEVLAWITRIEMAKSSMSFSCKLFKQLCFPKLHENVKPHKIKQLEFRAGCCNFAYSYIHQNGHNKQLPIPNAAPSYILGFHHIYIQFLDEQLLKFVQNILPRLNRIQFSMGMHVFGLTLEDRRTNSFRRLLDLLANKIVKFIFHDYYACVFEFNQLFPGFIQKVDFLCARPIPTEFDILFDWLTIPLINGEKQQKILELKRSIGSRIDKFIGRIKKEFSNASEPRNYFIKCPSSSRVAHFNMENEKTGEILTLYPTEERKYNYLLRCPKDEENYWNREGEMKMRKSWTWDDENETFIEAQIDKFMD